jgi:hypothetical protein
MTAIRTRGLTKDFGDLRAVNSIDLDLLLLSSAVLGRTRGRQRRDP